MKHYDFLVLGGGSAGFNAARLAGSLGLKTALVDGARELGGLCILRGCMPSKTLLYPAEVLHLAQKGKVFGLHIPVARVDMKALHARKKKIIKEFADHRKQQLLKGSFDLHRSHGRFVDPHTIALKDGTLLRAKKILIGTGSRISTPDITGLAEAKFLTSDDVLDLDFVPKSVIVLGGGIVATELAQFLNRIGSKVTLIQRSPHILREHSTESSKVIEQAFRDEGIDVITDTSLKTIKRTPRGVEVHFTRKGRVSVRRATHGFNALGRLPNTHTLNLAAAGIKTDDKGAIMINRWQQTNLPHIYAAGDCAGPVEIVHIAIQQAEVATRHAARIKKNQPVNFEHLLSVVFTDPQLATIGLSERILKEKGVAFIAKSYPFNDHGKSILMDANYGHVKVFAEPKRGRILGAEIVGKDAGELIHAFSGPLVMKATVFDLLRAPWYHPTLAEILTYPLEDIATEIK